MNKSSEDFYSTPLEGIEQNTLVHQYSSLWITLSAMMLGFSFSTPIMAATTTEIEQWLQAHNNYRTLHGVSAVTWSETIAANAQIYADTCPSVHSNSGYGENQAWASYNMGIGSIVQMWYDEEPNYDYNDPGFSSDTGHFTQVVWKATTEIGCAFATGCDSDWPYMANAWVCQYNPPGNYISQFAENVFPPNSENEDDGDYGTTPTDGRTIVPTLHLLLLKGQEGSDY